MVLNDANANRKHYIYVGQKCVMIHGTRISFYCNHACLFCVDLKKIIMYLIYPPLLRKDQVRGRAGAGNSSQVSFI